MYRSLVFLITVAILLSKQAHAVDYLKQINDAKASSAALGKSANDSFAKVNNDFQQKYIAGAAKEEGVSEAEVKRYISQQGAGSVSQVYNASSLPTTTTTGTNTATLNNTATTTATSATSATGTSIPSAPGLNLASQKDLLNAPITFGDGSAELVAKTAAVVEQTAFNCAGEFGRSPNPMDTIRAQGAVPDVVKAVMSERRTTTPAEICARVIVAANLPGMGNLICASKGQPLPCEPPPDSYAAYNPQSGTGTSAAALQAQQAEQVRGLAAAQMKAQLDEIAALVKADKEKRENDALMVLLSLAVGGGDQDFGPIMQLLQSQGQGFE